jgi:hypothetical protein
MIAGIEPPDPPRGDGGGRVLRDLLKAIKIIGTTGAVVAFVALIPAGSAFGRLIAALAIATGVLQIVEVFEWKADKRCASEEVRPILHRALAIRTAAIASLILGGLLLRSAQELVIGATCVTVVLCSSFWIVKRRLDRVPLADPSDDLGDQSGPLCIVNEGADGTEFILRRPNGYVHVILHGKPAEKAATILWALRHWRRIAGYASLTAALLLVIATTALGLGVFVGKWAGPAPRPKPIVHRVHSAASAPSTAGGQARSNTGAGAAGASTTSSTARTSAPSPPASSPNQPDPSTPSWNGACPSLPFQSEAKEPLIGSFVRLYDEESHLKPEQEGCIGHIYPHTYKRGSRPELYGTMTAGNPVSGQPLTYSVVSELYGGVLVTYSLAPLIEHLIAEVGPVGGVGRYPHYVAGSSGCEFYLIRTPPRNVYIFIRQDATESWVKLLPTVARAFLGRIKEVGWVLVSPPVPGPGHTMVYRLRSEDSFKHNEGEIVLHTNGEATRGPYRYPATPATELNLAELETIAAEA